MSVKKDNILDTYFKELKKFPQLTHDQVIELAKQIAEKNEEAKKELIECNLKLVVYIAKKYIRLVTYSVLLDLIREGNLGLLRAVKKFDWKKGCKFSVYAQYWIKNYIHRALCKKMIISVPEKIAQKILKFNKVKMNLLGQLNREPLIEEIALKMKLSVDEAHTIRETIFNVVSLEDFVSEDPDYITTKEEISIFNPNSPYEILKKILKNLSEREQKIIFMKFGTEDGNEHTHKQIGIKLGLSMERVRQIKIESLKKLREMYNASNLL